MRQVEILHALNRFILVGSSSCHYPAKAAKATTEIALNPFRADASPMYHQVDYCRRMHHILLRNFLPDPQDDGCTKAYTTSVLGLATRRAAAIGTVRLNSQHRALWNEENY